MNKILKRVLIGAGVFVGVVVLGAGGYVGYVILSYNRIGNCDLEVQSKSTLEQVNVGDTTVKGVVEAATRGTNPQVQINGVLYDLEKINAVYGN